MRYEYQNSEGEVRDIFTSMKAAPPNEVVFLPDGSWRPAKKRDKARFVRVYGAVQVNARPATGKYPIVSNTLPHHLPGCQTDKHGRTIVESAAHAREICKKHGFVQNAF